LTDWQAVRCVAFDFDGTLVDSNRIKRGAYFDAVAGVPGGEPALERVLAEHPRDDRHGILRKVHDVLSRDGADPLPTAEELVAAYSAICEARVIACPVMPGAGSALSALRESHALYLASATPEDALERVVAGRGWGKLFRGVYGGPRSKVENLERIGQREHLQRHEIVYVGDGAVDREAAREFGCPFLGVGTPASDLGERLAGLLPLVRVLAGSAQG
jgi:phosphoglycolate phosphatase